MFIVRPANFGFFLATEKLTQAQHAFDDDPWWEEQVVNQAENALDDDPWWIILPGIEDHNHPMDLYDYQLSSACSPNDPLPRWVASAVQCEDAQYVQSVVGSAFDYNGALLVNF